MITQLKDTVKVVLSWFFNWTKLLRLGELGRSCSIGRGLMVHGPGAISVGNKVRLGRFARLSCYSKDNVLGRIVISDNCYIGDHFSALSADNLVIERNVLIASYVAILAENHSINPECGVPYGLQPLDSKPVRIGEYSWIGEKVIVLPGAEIGKWCVIGAGSVVTKSIPDYSMAVGNPAKVIRKYDFSSHSWKSVN